MKISGMVFCWFAESALKYPQKTPSKTVNEDSAIQKKKKKKNQTMPPLFCIIITSVSEIKILEFWLWLQKIPHYCFKDRLNTAEVQWVDETHNGGQRSLLFGGSTEVAADMNQRAYISSRVKILYCHY